MLFGLLGLKAAKVSVRVPVLVDGQSREAVIAEGRVLHLGTLRIDCAAVKLDASRLMFAGGVDDHPTRGTLLSSATIYDALSNSWQDLPDMSTPRHGCAGAVLGGTVYGAVHTITVYCRSR